MADMNKVFLIGNLTRDPQLRRTSGGSAVTDLGLAVSDNYKNRDGELVERTCFVDISAWGRQAETCEQYLRKGSPILVEGRLEFDSWENDRGEKRSKLRVRASRVQFLGGRSSSQQQDSAPQQSPSPSRQQDSYRQDERPPSPPNAVDDDAPFGSDEEDPDNLPF